MAEVTNELMYELLKKMQNDISSLKFETIGTRTELSSVRGTLAAMQMDVHQIYSRLDRVDQRQDRIENRLELRELQDAQSRFEPHP
ncbi:MAG: hypothetical protein ACK4N1_08795 [Pseudorhizobium sp.]